MCTWPLCQHQCIVVTKTLPLVSMIHNEYFLWQVRLAQMLALNHGSSDNMYVSQANKQPRAYLTCCIIFLTSLEVSFHQHLLVLSLPV